ncbi:hypothetical protein HRW30_001927 [Salmonella enterica]|nr:hypothetical protein [Salmonella enterica]ELD8110418.1 hypothetical protein [Salmonella enterica subsp. enterica serovar Benin]EBC1277265.1 hypothetical protein [Salmonella enterica]EBE7296577.1 hypothetical protein [Salmonella enterica]EFU9293127.1 hypothetical protein [Salmonella enterica]
MASLTATDRCFLNLIITTKYSAPKKLTPLEELKQMKARFISLGEAIERVRAQSPGMTQPQAAEWIFGKVDGQTRLVKHSIAGKTRSVSYGELKEATAKDDSWINSYGFIRSELERVLDMDLSAPFPVCHQNDVYVEVVRNGEPEGAKPPPADIAGNSKSLANKHAGWEPRFAGKKTAMEIIAALSKIIMEKSGNKYRRGNGVSASAIADSVVETLNKTDSQKYRKLISEALRETKVADAD